MSYFRLNKMHQWWLQISFKRCYTLKQDWMDTKLLDIFFRSVADSCILRKSRCHSVWQQMWPDRSESSEWRRSPRPGRELWVWLSFDPSVHEPLPQVFVKKAVATLFVQENVRVSWSSLEKQIFVHMCKYPARHTSTTYCFTLQHSTHLYFIKNVIKTF